MGDFVHFIEFLYKFSIPLYHLYKAPFAFSCFLPSPFTLIVYQTFTVKLPPFAFILPSSSFISRQFSHSIHTYLPIGSYSFQHRSIPLKSCIQTLIQVFPCLLQGVTGFTKTFIKIFPYP